MATSKTLAITARQLKQLLDPVIPLAGRDAMLPVINSIRLEARDGWITASATDRFRLGISRIEQSLPIRNGFQATIGLEDVRAIARFFKPTKYANPDLVLTAAADRLTVKQDGEFDLLDASLTFRLITGDYPDLTKLVRGLLATQQETCIVNVNAGYLADFRHAAGDGKLISIRVNKPDKPVLILGGRHFIGGVMPLRSAGRAKGDGLSEVVEAWGSFLGAPSKATAKKAAARKPAAKKAAAKKTSTRQPAKKSTSARRPAKKAAKGRAS